MAQDSSNLAASSLEQLKALEQLGDQYQCLLDASRLAGIGSAPGKKPRGHAKAEWVLRWLLQKLKSNDSDSFSSLQLNVDAWKLLTELLDIVPEANVARLFQAIQITQIAAESINAAIDSHAEAAILINGSSNRLKRKRDEADLEGSLDSVRLVREILSFFKKLVAKSTRQDHQDSVDCFQVRSILRIPSDEAANLLSSCFKAVISLLNDSKELLRDDLLTSVLAIWKGRKLSAEDDFGASAHGFSSNLLVPASALYGCSELSTCLIHELEELFFEHLFAPLRNNFISEKRKGANQDALLRQLLEYFKPLKTQLFELPSSEESRLIRDAFPNLFRIAVRRSKISTQKFKLMEEAWLESILTVLLECTGDLSRDSSDHSSRPHQRDNVLEELLSVTKHHGLSLSPDFLGMILFQTSGLFRSGKSKSWNKDDVRVSVITKVMEQNPTLVVNPESISNSATALDVRTPLFAYISNVEVTDSWENREGLVNREPFVQNTVIPLMEAFVKTRKLPDFISHWYNELKTQAEIIAGPDQGPSAWTSQLLVDRISEKCRSELAVIDLKDLIQEYFLQFPDARTNFENHPLQPQFCASLIVMEGLLGGMKTTPEFFDLLDQVDSWLKNLLVLGKIFRLNLRIEGRLWRLLSIIQSYKLGFANSTEYLQTSKNSMDSILKSAEYQFSLQRKWSGVGSGMSALNEMFTYTISYLANVVSTGLPSKEEQSLINKFYGLISGSLGIISSEDASFEYSEFPLPRSIIINAAQVAVKFPVILLALGRFERSALFRAVLTSESKELLEAMKESIVELGSLDVQKDWIAFLPESAYNPSKVAAYLEQSNRKNINLEDAFSGVFEESMTRKERERLLDMMIPDEAQASSEEFWKKQVDLKSSLYLIARLTLRPFEKAKLYTDPIALFRLADGVDSAMNTTITKTQTFELVDTFRFIARRVLDLHTQAGQVCSETFLNRMGEFICEVVCKVPNFFQHLKFGRLGRWILIVETFAVVRSHDLKACKACEKILHGTVAKEIQRCVTSINESGPSDDNVFGLMLAVSLGTVVPLDQLPLSDLFQVILDCRFQSFLNHDGLNQPQMKILVDVARLATDHQFDSGFKWPLLYRKMLDIPELSPSAKSSILKIWDNAKEDQFLEAYSEIGSETLGSLILRHKSVQEMNVVINDDSRMLVVKSHKHLLAVLSLQLKLSTELRTAGYAVTDILEILHHKSILVDQFGIESVLEAVFSACCQPEKVFLKDCGPNLYLKFCQIVNILLLLHRRRLGERMHLVTPIIEILMSALIIPHPKSNTNKTQRPPVWLSSAEGVLDATHANAYVRILQTFTHPTVSSVSRTHHQPNSVLTDETRKARKYAADYVPYLLIHYCGLQLIGRLSQQVRKTLMPGIWACIEIVPHEKLLGMSASMGRDDREIWRSLWAEWKRSQGRDA